MQKLASAFILIFISTIACQGVAVKKGETSLEDSFLYKQPIDSLRLPRNNPKSLEKSTIKCFESTKLDLLLQKNKSAKDAKKKSDDQAYVFGNPENKLSDADFTSLDVMGLIVYAHGYPEQYVQSCSLYSKELNYNTKIHSSLPRKGEGFHMSERQFESLQKNKDSVIFLLNHCFENATFINDEYKSTIVNLNDFEIIPILKKMLSIQETKDSYILTVFNVLMKNDKYAPFMSSDIYRAIYDENRPDYKYDMTVDVTKKRYDEILTLASSYYNFKHSGK